MRQSNMIGQISYRKSSTFLHIVFVCVNIKITVIKLQLNIFKLKIYIILYGYFLS